MKRKEKKIAPELSCGNDLTDTCTVRRLPLHSLTDARRTRRWRCSASISSGRRPMRSPSYPPPGAAHCQPPLPPPPAPASSAQATLPPSPPHPRPQSSAASSTTSTSHGRSSTPPVSEHLSALRCCCITHITPVILSLLRPLEALNLFGPIPHRDERQFLVSDHAPELFHPTTECC